MWVLPFLGYVGMVFGFSFLTLAIASGLYYLSELVEEHTVFCKKLLTRLIQSIIAIHALLLVLDGFPFLLTAFSAASHVVYLMNITRTFPMVKLTDGVFILSCLLVLGNHFLWFKHFSNPPLPAYPTGYTPVRRGGSSGSPYEPPRTDPRFPSFTEISAFFGICVWLVPFSLFVSLSAGENVLPSSEIGGGAAGGTVGMMNENKRKVGMAKMVFGSVKEWIGSTGQALGVVREGGRHARFE